MNSAQDAGAIYSFDSLDLYNNTFFDNIGVDRSGIVLGRTSTTKYNFYNNLFVSSDSSAPLCALGAWSDILTVGGHLATDNSCTGFGITTSSAVKAMAPPDYNGWYRSPVTVQPQESDASPVIDLRCALDPASLRIDTTQPATRLEVTVNRQEAYAGAILQYKPMVRNLTGVAQNLTVIDPIPENTEIVRRIGFRRPCGVSDSPIPRFGSSRGRTSRALTHECPCSRPLKLCPGRSSLLGREPRRRPIRVRYPELPDPSNIRRAIGCKRVYNGEAWHFPRAPTGVACFR